MDENKVMKFSVVEPNRVYVPEYTESTSGRQYVFWGEDNQFPLHINDMYKGSATLRAVIDGTVKYICGNGISLSPEAMAWEKEINRRGETLEDLIEQTSTDMLKYNGFAIQIIYNKMGAVKELYALDFGRCRVSADFRKVYYAKKWGQYTAKFDEYDAFDRDHIDMKKMTQIFWYKGAARTIYPLPTWEGAFRDCLAEIAASKYVLNNMANGLAAKTIITIPNTSGLMTEDEKKAVETSIKTKFTGPDADSSFFLYFKTETGEEMKVDKIEVQDESEKFEKIKESARENIFISFRATPALFGLPNKNNGFTQQEFMEAFRLYQKTQVQGYQKKIERALDKIFATEGGVTILPFAMEEENTGTNNG